MINRNECARIRDVLFTIRYKLPQEIDYAQSFKNFLPSLIEIEPRERFVDLVLVKTDPRTGELITNSEKDPTKWGDWQHGGRVSDF